jgi:hypothetical protein
MAEKNAKEKQSLNIREKTKKKRKEETNDQSKMRKIENNT